MRNNYNREKRAGSPGTWNQQIGRLKRAYTQLQYSDLNYQESRKDQLIEALVVKLGTTEKELLDVMAQVRD